MKPLLRESRQPLPVPPSRLPREIVVILTIKVVAMTVLWWAFFSPSSPERPPAIEFSRHVFAQQPVSPALPVRSPE